MYIFVSQTYICIKYIYIYLCVNVHNIQGGIKVAVLVIKFNEFFCLCIFMYSFV